MDQVKNEINEVKKREAADKLAREEAALSNNVSKTATPRQPARQKKRYNRANSEKLFSEIENDIDDILNSGIFFLYFFLHYNLTILNKCMHSNIFNKYSSFSWITDITIKAVTKINVL